LEFEISSEIGTWNLEFLSVLHQGGIASARDKKRGVLSETFSLQRKNALKRMRHEPCSKGRKWAFCFHENPVA